MPVKLSLSTLNLANSQYAYVFVVFFLISQGTIFCQQPQHTFLNEENASFEEALRTATNSGLENNSNEHLVSSYT